MQFPVCNRINMYALFDYQVNSAEHQLDVIYQCQTDTDQCEPGGSE